MRDLPWIVGGGALAYYVWSRTRDRARESRPAITALPGHWVWPVASWGTRRPVISDGFDSPRPGLPRHGGVDIMFRREPGDTFAAGTPNGTRMFVMPDEHPVLAASDGVVWSAMKTPHGQAVVIDHGPRKVATFYTHLDKLFVSPTARAAAKQRVQAGQPLGTVGFSPLDAQRIKHLHFEIWLGGPGDRIDPTPLMKHWEHAGDRGALVARNASTTYRRIGASGEPYPQWVRDLKGKSGVYLIRDMDTRELLYVGSSTRRLYDTLTRHFQRWRRYKGFWRGQYGEGHDPGLTYPRDRVEVAVRITQADDALDEESRLIARMRPRDNLLGQPAEEVPF